jgi:pilus assembly protein Flp/PilA
MEKIKRFLMEEEGTETVEWAIIIGLIAVASIATIVGIGTWVSGKFTSLNTAIQGH